MIFIDKFLANLKRRNDNDFVDRLNYYYTPVLLTFFALMLSAKQYAGQPIQCWMPAQFIGAWEQYAEFLCFVKNTYFVRFQDDLPKLESEREQKEIGYYQWVPFVLFLQAFLFFIPMMVWRLFNWHTGIKVKGIIGAAADVTNMEDEARSKNATLVAKHIQDSLMVQRELKNNNPVSSFFFYGKHHGVYVTTLYLFVKILFIINAIGQLFILNSFLGPQYTFWGVDILRDLINNRPWEESGHFPRVTMCDFKVRTLGNMQNHSVQCVLMINMFNEKIYLFLWWWFLIVACMTIMNFIYWLTCAIVKGFQTQYVEHYLHVYQGMKEDKEDGGPISKREMSEFVNRELRPDGVFLLRLIAANAGDIVATDLVGAMWKLFRDKKKERVPPPPSVTGEKTTEPGKNVVDPGFVENVPEENVPLTRYQPMSK